MNRRTAQACVAPDLASGAQTVNLRIVTDLGGEKQTMDVQAGPRAAIEVSPDMNNAEKAISVRQQRGEPPSGPALAGGQALPLAVVALAVGVIVLTLLILTSGSTPSCRAPPPAICSTTTPPMPASSAPLLRSAPTPTPTRPGHRSHSASTGEPSASPSRLWAARSSPTLQAA